LGLAKIKFGSSLVSWGSLKSSKSSPETSKIIAVLRTKTKVAAIWTGHHPDLGLPAGGPGLIRGAVPGRPGQAHSELHLHQLHQHWRTQTLQEPVSLLRKQYGTVVNDRLMKLKI
jgi:hypothetical protein